MKLQGKGHIFVYGHMGIQGIALEYHRDIPILGRHIVHSSVADVQVAFTDLLQTRDHAEGRGLPQPDGPTAR